MTHFYPTTSAPAWHWLTRLGELQIMLPMLLAAAWALRLEAPRLAGRWVVAAAAAILLTTASKVAFLGFGWGVAALDFTGVSGHALMATAVLPLLLHLSVRPWADGARGAGLAAGAALALAVTVSRVVLGAHSSSEAAAGLLLGGAVSAVALAAGPMPRLRLPPAFALALLAAVSFAVAEAPPSRTHDWVTRLALAVSGRPQPYTRWQMHRDQQRADARTRHIPGP